MSPTILNVVSGKGGTGKTLLACVLADMLGNAADSRTVVVDLDFFVRGLTSLLYFHQDEKLEITGGDVVTVAHFFAKKQAVPISNLAVLKYRSFDVVPAVDRIDERLNFDDIGPNTQEEARRILSSLIRSLGNQYSYIILDSRAGYDELVSAAHELSRASICVEEQDPISRITSENLISQLSADSRVPVFRLVNKVRGIRSVTDFRSGSQSVTDLGLIPFDMDILSSFGMHSFWDTVAGSLYRWALAKSWNVLSAKLQLKTELQMPRVSPVVDERAESILGFLGTKERVLFAYGALLGVLGIGYGFVGREVLLALREDPTRAASIAIGIAGITLATFASFKKR
jgi:septum site-determining protein MinD